MLKLKAFFDESGKQDQSISCVGGCISSFEDWEKFEEAWSLVLREYGVKWHHQVDWTHNRGQFQGWEKERKEAYQGNLLRIMHQFIFRYIGAAIRLSDYNRLSEEQRSVAIDPYLPCLQVALHVAACEAKGLQEDEKVDVLIAKNTKLGGRAYDLYEKACLYLPENDRKRLSRSVTIKDMPHACERDTSEEEVGIPLQAADLVAYELNKYVEGRDRFPMRQLMQEKEHYYWKIFEWKSLNEACQFWAPR